MTMVLEERPRFAADAAHIVAAAHRSAVRADLRRSLREALGSTAIHEADDFAALSAAIVASEGADLVLLDLALPGLGGLSGLFYLRSRHPRLPLVVLPPGEDASMIAHRCLEAGAAAVIEDKADAEALRNAIRSVLSGEAGTPAGPEAAASTRDPDAAETMRRLDSLTPQQLRVLMLLTEGLLNKQIAFILTVSEATVKAHVSAILQKLGVNNRVQAVAAVSRVGVKVPTTD